jgi:hypothetical protein
MQAVNAAKFEGPGHPMMVVQTGKSPAARLTVADGLVSINSDASADVRS